MGENMKNLFKSIIAVSLFTLFNTSCGAFDFLKINSRFYISNQAFSPDNEKLFFTLDTNSDANFDNVFSHHSILLYNLKNKSYNKLDDHIKGYVFKTWWLEPKNILLDISDKDLKKHEMVKYNYD